MSIHTAKPEVYIHIGIREDKVVMVDWATLKLRSDKLTNDEIKALVIQGLEEAIVIVKTSQP